MKLKAIESVGFIGLGVMGEAMCRNLAAKGTWPMTVFDLRLEPLVRMAASGAARADSANDIADKADLVITCLPGGAEVRELVLGQDGLLEALKPGQVLVDMSTSPQGLMKEIAERADKRGVGFADAPIARTRQAAEDGTLAIMVGAEPELFDVIKPVLDTMGSEIVHCGPPGSGQVVKIMNNMVLFQTVAALSEALSMAEGAGVDGKILLETLAKGSGDSFAARNHGLKSLLPQDYPERAFSVHYAAKDLSYALELAREHGVRTPGAENVAALFEEAIAAGDGGSYFPVIRKRLDRKA